MSDYKHPREQELEREPKKVRFEVRKIDYVKRLEESGEKGATTHSRKLPPRHGPLPVEDAIEEDSVLDRFEGPCSDPHPPRADRDGSSDA